MRGKDVVCDCAHVPAGITPACAGKSCGIIVYDNWVQDHPRMCGEKKSFANSIEMELGSPPHVRGKDIQQGCSHALCRITPACAGKSLTSGRTDEQRMDHPRMCGEKCNIPLSIERKGGSPPHVRGKGFRSEHFAGFGGITPACAGKSCTKRLPMRQGKDHPRMCGEKTKKIP